MLKSRNYLPAGSWLVSAESDSYVLAVAFETLQPTAASRKVCATLSQTLTGHTKQYLFQVLMATAGIVDRAWRLASFNLIKTPFQSPRRGTGIDLPASIAFGQLFPTVQAATLVSEGSKTTLS